jgi:hypothetical protein
VPHGVPNAGRGVRGQAGVYYRQRRPLLVRRHVSPVQFPSVAHPRKDYILSCVVMRGYLFLSSLYLYLPPEKVQDCGFCFAHHRYAAFWQFSGQSFFGMQHGFSVHHKPACVFDHRKTGGFWRYGEGRIYQFFRVHGFLKQGLGQ